MPIPTSPRVTYEKNTLEEVICQLRFPSILRIGAEAPAVYQERVRWDYPRFLERSESPFTIPAGSGIPFSITKLVPTITSYEFASSDEAWKLTLAREFLALTCAKYTTWEAFRERLKVALDALVTEYRPAFFGRIGLRYRNLITRSALGLSDAAWSDLLNPHATGELATPLSRDVERIAKETTLRLDQFRGRVRVLLGTVRQEGRDEDSFLIDCDYFTDQEMEVTNALEALNYFNKQSGNLFRWYVQPRLNEAMVPRTL